MSSFVLPYAPSETVGLIPERLERITTVMARQVEEKKAPGVSMLIARHGKIAYRESVGALRPGGPPMSDDAIFRIYSMTKPIVSVAAMMLVEEGRLAITDPVSNYIPAFADLKVGVENGDRLDLDAAQAADHDPGPHAPYVGADLRLYRGLARSRSWSRPPTCMSSNRTLAENVEAIATLPLMHQPGEVWEYSISTDVLGRIVEIGRRRSSRRGPAGAHVRPARDGRHRLLHAGVETRAPRGARSRSTSWSRRASTRATRRRRRNSNPAAAASCRRSPTIRASSPC